MSYFGSIVQNVISPPENDTTVNLAAGATWNGTSSSTLGVAGIQVSLKTDQNCTVNVYQSPDGTNWDTTDTFTYYTAIGSFSQTVQAIASYTKISVTNNGLSATSYLRLQTALCPIVEAVPRSCTDRGYFKTSIQEIANEQNDTVLITPYRELQVEEPTKLVGSAFYGTTIDPNFWSSVTTNSGLISQSGGLLTLQTNTAGNGSSYIQSILTNRQIPGHASRFRTQIFQDSSVANNVRTWGLHDGTDGVYFLLDSTGFAVESKNNNSTSTVRSSLFNGKWGGTYLLDTSNHSFDIVISNARTAFYVDNVLLHRLSVVRSRFSSTLNLPIRISNANSGGSVTNVTMNTLSASVVRLGKSSTQARYKFTTGIQSGGVICKYGAGSLHRALLGANANGCVLTIYDSTTAGGAVLFTSCSINNNNQTSLDFGSVAFNNGLTYTLTGATGTVTLVYE